MEFKEAIHEAVKITKRYIAVTCRELEAQNDHITLGYFSLIRKSTKNSSYSQLCHHAY